MRCSIIFVVLAITFRRSLSQHCEVVESQHECGGYCYGAVKPVLEYLAILQKRVESCEAKQPADTQSKIALTAKKLETLERQVAIQQELIKVIQPADILSKIELMDEKIEALRNQTATQQKVEKSSKQSEEALSKITLVDEKLETLRTQMTALQNSEKISQSRLQRLEHFEKIGSKYYYIENKIRMNWQDALKKCREMGAHLVNLQSEDEWKALLGILKPLTYWIDLNDLETEGEFISATTGLKGTFFHWGQGDPNNKDNSEHCVELYAVPPDGWMNDQECNDSLYFICEKSFD